MPELRSDDGPRKLRAVWLGPAGSTLPFEWTYVQWLVVLLCIPAAVLFVGFLTWLFGFSRFMQLAIALTWGPAAGVYLGVRIMKGVTYDEPLNFRRRMAAAELNPRTRRGLPDVETWRLEMPKMRHVDTSLWALPDPQPHTPTPTLASLPGGASDEDPS